MAPPAEHPDSKESPVNEEEEEEFIPGLEKIQDETSPLTPLQEEEYEKLLHVLTTELECQKDVEANNNVLRLRDQFLHVHGTRGGERIIDAVIVLKAIQMVKQGMRVCILNLNFFKRLQTLALYFFLKDFVMRKSETLEKQRDMVFLKIQEEEADEEDRMLMRSALNDKAEDWPLFVITDESCKEIERIDDAVQELTVDNRHFHLWSSSTFAHGTPKQIGRHRLALNRVCPPPIKQVMDMIDVQDDDLGFGEYHKRPIRRMMYPFLDQGPDYNIREHLETLKVFLISHNRNHLEPDVWECLKCGKLLADYLNDVIGLGKPGLQHNEVFIAGHIERLESMVTISGLQVSLLTNGINMVAPFCRQAVRMEDVLGTTKGVVVSDSVSLRGTDKQIAIIIPNPRERALQEKINRDAKRRQEKERREQEDAVLAASIPDHGVPFVKPSPTTEDDEILLFLRPRLAEDTMDGIADYRKLKVKRTPKRGEDDEVLEDVTDDEDLSEDEEEDVQPKPKPKRQLRLEDMRFSEASNQSVLRRAINSMSQVDKDLILDVFTDAPRHAVLFHFAEDEFQEDPDV